MSSNGAAAKVINGLTRELGLAINLLGPADRRAVYLGLARWCKGQADLNWRFDRRPKDSTTETRRHGERPRPKGAADEH